MQLQALKMRRASGTPCRVRQRLQFGKKRGIFVILGENFQTAISPLVEGVTGKKGKTLHLT